MRYQRPRSGSNHHAHVGESRLFTLAQNDATNRVDTSPEHHVTIQQVRRWRHEKPVQARVRVDTHRSRNA
jgi:hypothetical protein